MCIPVPLSTVCGNSVFNFNGDAADAASSGDTTAHHCPSFDSPIVAVQRWVYFPMFASTGAKLSGAAFLGTAAQFSVLLAPALRLQICQ